MQKTVEERLAALEAAVEALKPIDVGDLNSEWANFVVRSSPRSWLETGGHDYTGQRLSACPPEFLDALASFLDWKGGKEEQEKRTYLKKTTGEQVPVAPLTRRDAERCRAWAKRLRETAPTQRVLIADPLDLPF